MITRRTSSRAILVGVAALVGVSALLAGCSQVAALAPVGGDHLTEIRYAAIDILLSEDVDVLVAPVCTADGEAVSCTGETADGGEIAVLSPADAPHTITVTVAGTLLYEGEYWDILDRAVRGQL